jgi:hypothetical protein
MEVPMKTKCQICCVAEADTRACSSFSEWMPLCVACALSNPDVLCAGCLDTAMLRTMNRDLESTFEAALPFGASYEDGPP